jgi:hypothetical protein
LQQLRVYRDSDIVSRIDRLTIDISPSGSGSIYLPSPAIFERINPSTAPLGLVFVDGSFLIFKETVRYGYIDKKAAAPQVYRLEYSYHYQRPQENSFFRYDFHPTVGDAESHPIHHLHAFGWPSGATKLPSVPRFAASEVTLGEVLSLIRRDFFAT